MSTYIESVATSVPHGRMAVHSALHLSDVAASRCLARGHRRAAELDLMINVGIYKDHGLAEPALASIIQEDLGANPGHPPVPDQHGTFSFDILSGGCGVITAAHVLDSFVGSGTAQLGLVVAGDADPSPRASRGFPFAPSGGALLLSHDDDGDAGFQRFAFRTFPADAATFDASTRWDPHAGWLSGRNVLEVREAPVFAAACREHAAEVARDLLRDAGVAASELDLLVASAYPRGFASQLARDLGVPEERTPVVTGPLARAHTVGPLAALEQAIESGAFAQARYTLFVTVGAGITVGAALYRAGSRNFRPR